MRFCDKNPQGMHLFDILFANMYGKMKKSEKKKKILSLSLDMMEYIC